MTISEFPVCKSPFHADDFTIAPGPVATAAGAVIRFPPNQQITVRPHVRAYANAAQESTGVSSWGTYLGHQPTPERALDAFTTKAQGDALCDWAMRAENWSRFGCRYLLWWHRINYNDGRGWLWVADQGNDTDNHMDHVHNGFEDTAEPIPEEDDMFDGSDRADLQHLKTVFDELKRELAQAAGGEDPNWHTVGERLNARLGRIEQRLASLGSGSGSIDLDALAEKVAANLAKRLES